MLRVDNFTTFMYPLSRKFGARNPEPSGPVQACTGIVLPLRLHIE